MYLAGFGNHHQSEAIPGALPKEQNSPQNCPFNSFAEQLSGSAFTQARHINLHSWLYRIAPSVVQTDFTIYEQDKKVTFLKRQPPNPFRWSPYPLPEHPTDFIDGMHPIAKSHLVNAYIYQCNVSMTNRVFSNSDGEMLFVPYVGEIVLFTEFGRLALTPGKIAVIPRGVKFKMILTSPTACGYLAENTGEPLRLPSLGTIGANGLANPRHFLYPIAAYEEISTSTTLICKYQHYLWSCKSTYSPLNVLAWHGNYAPYSYDLNLFNTINTVSFDHPDPSIFTVLTSESTTEGVANFDFVIFPPLDGGRTYL